MAKEKNIIHKLPENFRFRFTMVEDYCEKDESSQQEFGEFRGDYPLCAYEKYLYIYYMLNAGEYILNLYTEDLISKAFIVEAVEWLKDLTHSFMHTNSIIKKYNIEKLELQLDAIPELHYLIASTFKAEGYICLSTKTVIGIPKYAETIYKYMTALFSELTAWCKKQEELPLKKAYYMEHLHAFLKLTGITNQNIRRLVEFMLLQQNINFTTRLNQSAYKTNERPLKLAGCKNFKVSNLVKYMNILFRDNYLTGYLKDKYIDAKFVLSTFVYTICFTETATDEEFYEKCLPLMKKTELQPSDFAHIEQVPYLISILENALKEKRKGVNILLYGKPGTGKTALAKVLIQAVTKDAYEVLNTDWTNQTLGRFVVSSTDDQYNNKMRIDNFFLIRCILNQNPKSIILYDEAEDFFRKKDIVSQAKGLINEVLENNTTPTIWTTNNLTCMEESYFRRFTYVLNIDELPRDIYAERLNTVAQKYNLELDEDTENICMQYKPNLGLIDKTFSNFRLSGSDDQDCLRTDLLDALKCQNYGEDLPPLISNKFEFNPDLVNASINLKELTKQIKKNGRLDFGMLLYGVPGSSKSSFGKYLAEQLGLKVICRNYTELASMWVGETEHNIAKLFKDGTVDQAVIILDEADVLLRDRTQARASWEVSQTEALLTEMENYEYPFIMTTNLFESLDAAVMRRFLYKVKHDYLKSEQVKLAFKHFFGINIKENLHLSRLTSGDFALVKKQAEFQDKLKDKKWLIDRLTEEMQQKKDSRSSPTIKF